MTTKKKPVYIEVPLVDRVTPYIRVLDADHVVIMQKVTYIENGQRKHANIILEKVKKKNARARYRANCTRTYNARRTRQFGHIKLEVAS